jgi:hypothetical protein
VRPDPQPFARRERRASPVLSPSDSLPLAPGLTVGGCTTVAAVAAVITLCARVAALADSGKMGRLGREAGPSRRATVPFQPPRVTGPPAQ